MVYIKTREKITINTSDIEAVENRYNGEHDLIPGAPVVTWADEQLRYSLHQLIPHIQQLLDDRDLLIQAVNDLQKQITELEARLDYPNPAERHRQGY